jgi:hypothetical protein
MQNALIGCGLLAPADAWTLLERRKKRSQPAEGAANPGKKRLEIAYAAYAAVPARQLHRRPRVAHNAVNQWAPFCK